MHTRPFYTPPGLPAFRMEPRRRAPRRVRIRRGSVMHFGRIAVCLAVISMLAADTVFACRWFVRRRAYCRPVYCQPVQCAPITYSNGCSAPMTYGGAVDYGGSQAPGLPPPPMGTMQGGRIPWEIVPPGEGRGAGGRSMDGAGGRGEERRRTDEPRRAEPRDDASRVDPDAIQRPRIDVGPAETTTLPPDVGSESTIERRTEGVAPRTLPRAEPRASDNPFDVPATEPRDAAPMPRDNAVPLPRDDAAPAPRTEPAPPAASDNPFEAPAATERTPATEPAPMPEPRSETPPSREPAPPAAADDPFGTPPAATPRGAAADEPFGSPPANTPRATAPADDPFGAPPAATPPAETKEAPANPFGGAPAETPATETPAAETPAPVATPVSEPAKAGDDPFGGTTGVRPASAIDDPFAPAAATEETKEPAPAAESAKEPADNNPFTAPVGPRLNLDQASAAPMDTLRDWTDDTGDYRVRGRLKVILPDRAKIRILKTNGKYTTVPLDRLSQSDREFVERHLSVELALLASISR